MGDVSDLTASQLQPGDRVVLVRTVVASIEVAEGRRLVVWQHEEGHEPTLICAADRTFRRVS